MIIEGKETDREHQEIFERSLLLSEEKGEYIVERAYKYFFITFCSYFPMFKIHKQWQTEKLSTRICRSNDLALSIDTHKICVNRRISAKGGDLHFVSVPVKSVVYHQKRRRYFQKRKEKKETREKGGEMINLSQQRSIKASHNLRNQAHSRYAIIIIVGDIFNSCLHKRPIRVTHLMQRVTVDCLF